MLEKVSGESCSGSAVSALRSSQRNGFEPYPERRTVIQKERSCLRTLMLSRFLQNDRNGGPRRIRTVRPHAYQACALALSYQPGPVVSKTTRYENAHFCDAIYEPVRRNPGSCVSTRRRTNACRQINASWRRTGILQYADRRTSETASGLFMMFT